ncbi:TetR/AcrR family transcriptional regulator [Spirosoma radiotolerans]|uniref:TetR/AcrR family transcriptional regulator n=1 Tax=Spirosoma radiotolerans TaxID=1379870 RepID=UPI0006984FFE|nr:TetR/AcrR family transcriptional regulator [Spirosoma radiotolerans]
MTADQESTKNRILTEAITVFQQKGLLGARMQEIADKAGINKAMLHYYFKTKEELFSQVFQQALTLFVVNIQQILASERTLVEKVSQYVDYTTSALSANPSIPSFVLHELNRDPLRLVTYFAGDNRLNLTRFTQHFSSTQQANQFFANMVSLCIYPFVARPMMEKLFGMSPQAYDQFLLQRKELIKSQLMQQL